MHSWSPWSTCKVAAGARVPSALDFWGSWFGLLFPFLAGILLVHLQSLFQFSSTLQNNPKKDFARIWNQSYCPVIRPSTLFKIFLRKWNACRVFWVENHPRCDSTVAEFSDNEILQKAGMFLTLVLVSVTSHHNASTCIVMVLWHIGVVFPSNEATLALELCSFMHVWKTVPLPGLFSYNDHWCYSSFIIFIIRGYC